MQRLSDLHVLGPMCKECQTLMYSVLGPMWKECQTHVHNKRNSRGPYAGLCVHSVLMAMWTVCQAHMHNTRAPHGPCAELTWVKCAGAGSPTCTVHVGLVPVPMCTGWQAHIRIVSGTMWPSVGAHSVQRAQCVTCTVCHVYSV